MHRFLILRLVLEACFVYFVIKVWPMRGGLVISALDSGSRGLGSSPA